jgi:hypothetical protein
MEHCIEHGGMFAAAERQLDHAFATNVAPLSRPLVSIIQRLVGKVEVA